ncbi:YqgQ family protein [Desertibacillus haloalkaliphilus]|uniref:YqgQ family protein n=1 Tax=Desertibacillus haloalkaliphilus TaxID=1328930 RepID=UPI001C274135|nr:YqgQ family protein [Desertibacillus haloalkaliphilus]MBU8905734.1 YqgQ family protein [Desertibacillus haloalkaliphilus]
MKTIMDIQQLLKRFGTIIYTGDRLSDFTLMEEELRELYQWEMIDSQTFQQALLLLRTEASKLKS